MEPFEHSGRYKIYNVGGMVLHANEVRNPMTGSCGVTVATWNGSLNQIWTATAAEGGWVLSPGNDFKACLQVQGSTVVVKESESWKGRTDSFSEQWMTRRYIPGGKVFSIENVNCGMPMDMFGRVNFVGLPKSLPIHSYGSIHWIISKLS